METDLCLLRIISIHALREEGDLCVRYSTQLPIRISIHALREEGDKTTLPAVCLLLYFYPRPPRGGRLCSSRHR